MFKRWWSNIDPTYRSWIIAILLLPLLFFFVNSLDNVDPSSSDRVKIVGVSLLFPFCVIFFFWSIYESALIRNVEMEFQELEREDVDRLLRRLKITTLVLFCLSMVWLIVNLVFAFIFTFHGVAVFYGMLSPFVILLILIYRYRKINSVYTDYYANN